MKAFIIGLVVVVILGVGGYALVNQTSNKDSTTNTTSTDTSSQNTTPATNDTSTTTVSATITFDGSRFSPNTLTVPAGTVFTFHNTASRDVQMSSDPHPAHTDDTDLNIGLVVPGQSKTFTVTKTGTFGFHDHLDESIRGQITIQ